MSTARVRQRKSALLRESYVETRLACGLRALVYAKPGFVKKAAMVVSAYGSLDTTFDADGTGPKATPAGIAHFLEHQLFKKQRGDLLMEYGRFGASANAFTYYNSTCFFFTTSERFEPNLSVLLETAFTPWFSAEGVANEKQIIEQELRMYNDSPDRIIYRNLMAALYQKHLVREDIGGTVETIQAIDAPLLERCWRTFYHPSNLLFVAAGDLDARAVFRTLEKALPPRRFKAAREIRRVLPEEPSDAGAATVRAEAVISRPQVMIGWKDPVTGLDGALERDLATTVALDLLFGRGSEWYQAHYESGLIDDSFSFGYSMEDTFGFTMIGGETDDPARLADEVKGAMRRARQGGFTKSDVDRAKRKRLGRYLRAFNATDEAAFMLMGYAQHGFDPFAVPALIDRLTGKELSSRIAQHFGEQNVAVSILSPKA
jgi:predicted Zn-dependent peptidase